MKLLRLFAGIVVLATSVFAADADGKWTGNMSTPNGDVPVSFTFKAEGAALGGTTTGPDGSEVKIENGKVDGKNLSFSVTINFNGMPIVMNYKGAVAGNEIKFMIEIFGMPLDLTVKKS